MPSWSAPISGIKRSDSSANYEGARYLIRLKPADVEFITGPRDLEISLIRCLYGQGEWLTGDVPFVIVNAGIDIEVNFRTMIADLKIIQGETILMKSNNWFFYSPCFMKENRHFDLKLSLLELWLNLTGWSDLKFRSDLYFSDRAQLRYSFWTTLQILGQCDRIRAISHAQGACAFAQTKVGERSVCSPSQWRLLLRPAIDACVFQQSGVQILKM